MLNLLFSKKAMMGGMFDFMSFLKGIIIGIIIGAAFIYLIHKGILPITLP
jgi:uncharacterized protein (DUF2342 family)